MHATCGCVRYNPAPGKGVLMADPEQESQAPEEPPQPEDMNPAELKAFVQRALQASKKRPARADIRTWYETTTRITETDLRVRVR